MIQFIFIFCIVQIIGALNLNFFNINSKDNTVCSIKSKLLNISNSVNRGLDETPEERAEIKQLFEKLEKKNQLKSTLASPLLNAVWQLEYTTSDSILGRNGAKKIGPIFQTIDAVNLTAENREVVNYFGFLKIPRKVTAKLSPLSPSKVKVQFQVFSVGPISFKSPESAKGELDVTYVDKDIRLSRGDKGNIFVLSRYSDLK